MNSLEKSERNLRLVAIAQVIDTKEADEALGALITENFGLVTSIANRFKDRGIEYDDLLQIGTIGMIKAVRSFSFERGTAFSTYAVPHILGEMKRHIRDDGPIKISRAQKKLSIELCFAKNKIVQEEGRDPCISELAEIVGVSVEECAAALESINPISSLSETFGDDEKLTLESQLASDDFEIEKVQDKMVLASAIAKMSKEWQKIITLRYYRNMTQNDVASITGLSQVKVSREEKKILEFLKKELEV